MARRKRSKAKRERDLAFISNEYLRGKTQAEIANELKLSQQQIAYDIKALQARWRAESMINLGDRKAAELARIDLLERTYWNGWEKSCDERQTSNTEKIIKDGQPIADATASQAGQSKVAIRKEQRDGDPRFLDGVQWCISQRCKLLGLHAPLQHDVQVGPLLQTNVFSPLTLDEKKLLLEMHELRISSRRPPIGMSLEIPDNGEGPAGDGTGNGDPRVNR